ncbi:MAG: sigma-E processing peptidase SpoIIGA [Syntrophomonadaceae bacterium]|nr:sigma-E processing peptidase SpoIIGA [Syntrophomonadaceae bacterium]
MGDRPYVYLDILFCINFLMDYVILWAAARFGQFRTTFQRLVLASSIGALYSLSILLPGADYLLTIFVRIIMSIIMVLIAYGRLSLKKTAQALGYFYMVAFVTGGAMLGTIYLFSREIQATPVMSGMFSFSVNIRYTWLLAGLATAVLLGKWGSGYLKRNIFRSLLRLPVILCFGQVRIPVKALIDTGNNLKDPLTARPVVIVEYELLRPFLPQTTRNLYDNKLEPDVQELIKSLAESSWAPRVRMIPFSSIGKQKGMLLGLRPDEIIVVAEGKPVRVREVVLGIYQKRLALDRTYQALLHPDILQTAIGR